MIFVVLNCVFDLMIERKWVQIFSNIFHNISAFEHFLFTSPLFGTGLSRNQTHPAWSKLKVDFIWVSFHSHLPHLPVFIEYKTSSLSDARLRDSDPAAVATASVGATPPNQFPCKPRFLREKVRSDHNFRVFSSNFFVFTCSFLLLDPNITSDVFPGSKFCAVSFSVSDLDLLPCFILLCVRCLLASVFA